MPIMGIRLVVEVLDHYHGPDPKKLWLLAFAEKANDRTREGWPGRETLARRTGRSPARVSNIATELTEDKVLERVKSAGRNRGEQRYLLLPLIPDDDSQGSARANPEPVDNPSQGSARANPEQDVKGSEPEGSGFGQGELQGSAVSPRPAETPYIPQSLNKPSSPAAAALVRQAFPDATDEETETIIRDRQDRGARSVFSVIRHEISQGSLRLPCDPRGSASHTDACRSGDSARCRWDWCRCRCHVRQAEVVTR